MGNTSSIAELKSKADVHRKTRDALKSRREEHMKEAKEAAVEAAAVSGEDEEMDVLAPLPASEPRVGLSLMRGMSSKRFKREDEETSQWKLFNELDIQDDKMMLELANFLNKIVKSFESKPAMGTSTVLPPPPISQGATGEGLPPTLPEAEAAELFKEEDEYTQVTTRRRSINLDSIAVDEPDQVPSLMRIGSVDVRIGSIDSTNLQDYILPKDSLTLGMIHEVIQLYNVGGQLHLKSLRRVLREAYKIIKEAPTVRRIDMSKVEETVTVVGDLHGQLEDLLHLLNANGMPSNVNKYIFNGDFVDRGPKGVEILVVLFMLMIVYPGSVILNRGNHEDFGLCCVYGFQSECLTKYNEVVFSMFCEMFRHLPVCTVIHEKILVIHGGLFHRTNVTIEDLEAVERTEYVVPSSREDECPPRTEQEARERDLRTIMNCALWSDPDLEPSLPIPEPNPRGAGILFGPDITAHFLDYNDLSMVVRSHECVEEGFDLPFEDDMEDSCATIFSASNYGGSMNKGAIMRFGRVQDRKSRLAGGSKFGSPEDPIYYRVYDWQLAQKDDDGEGIAAANSKGLSTLVLRKKRILSEAFRQVDKDQSGFISRAKWSSIMEKVTGMSISWPALMSVLVDDEDIRADDGAIQWQNFLNKFHVQLRTKAVDDQSGALFDAVYSNRVILEAIFRFFDTDNNGAISREEFKRGCEILNADLPEGEKLSDFDAMLDLMDLDQNDAIDVNEFFEVFRLLDRATGDSSLSVT